MKAALIFGVSLLLVGCQTFKEPAPGDNPDYRPAFPETSTTGKGHVKVNDGSLYQSNRQLNLFATPIARHVGDVLTITLIEKTTAIKRAQTRAKKQSDNDTPNPTIFGKPVSLGRFGPGYNLEMDIAANRQFTGEAQSNQNNQLTGNISVTVARVLSNGNLVVQGEKWVRLNQGDEYVRLSGIVRQADISPDNTVPSTKVANARIGYSGTGQVNNANAQGWLSRFLWSAIYPF